MYSPLVRVSSILLIVNACFDAVLYRLEIDVYGQPATFNNDLYLTLHLGREIISILALLALIRQYREIRHWLGWTGVFLALGGYVTIATYFGLVLYLTGFSSQKGLYDTMIRYGLLALSLGIILWATDMPTAKNATLIQKAAMTTLGIIPILQTVVFPFSFPLVGSENLTNFVITSIISVIASLLLGISVWFHQETPSVTRSQLLSEQSEQMTDSPAPLTEY